MIVKLTQDAPATEVQQFVDLPARLQDLYDSFIQPCPPFGYPISEMSNCGYIKLPNGQLGQLRVELQTDQEEWIGDPEE